MINMISLQEKGLSMKEIFQEIMNGLQNDRFFRYLCVGFGIGITIVIGNILFLITRQIINFLL